MAMLAGCAASEAKPATDATTTTELVTTTSPPVTRGVVATAPPTTAPPATAAPRTAAPTTDPPVMLPAAEPSEYYANCTAAKNAGAAPLHRGDAGYRSALDRDSDGVACET